MSRIISLLAAFLMLAVPQLAAAYTISPGDRLQVDVLEDSSLNRTVLVLPDGTVNFPGAGTIRVGGSTPAAAQTAIASRLAPQFASPPSVYVSVAGLAPVTEQQAQSLDKIYVMGEINKPGVVETDEPVNLLQAIASAGGFTRFAATKRIELHRPARNGTEQVYIFDFKNRSGISGATPLAKGDVIVVPERRLFE